ncbi:MAG: D-2-hydroxyacid dehydrogenase [Gammaproteobacteria bacterium]|nr:D-2-hydroxyacid dehydrogenase [Gammaproteobacteria bacterium]
MPISHNNLPQQNGVILDLDSLSKNDLDLTEIENSLANWTYYGTTKPNEVVSRIKDTEVIVSNKVVLDHEVLSQAENLKLICIAATGTNNIDLQAANKLNIAVCNITNYATQSVPEHVFRLILSLYGRLSENMEAAVSGRWSESPYFCLLDYLPQDLHGKTMGIIGYGDLGQAVAKIAKNLDMKVLIAKRDKNDNRADRLSLDDLLPQVDILTLHCPLTELNKNLISTRELSLLPNHALLINTARGPLVDEPALLLALQNKDIAGAGLDVLSIEPPPRDHILLRSKLKNLIITPHIAWASLQSRQRLLNQVAENINAFKIGKTRNIL